MLNQSVYGQIRETEGKAVTEIFTDFHVNLYDTLQKTGFALERAYLGYQFLPEGKFSGKIILNVGSPEDLAPGSEPRRYGFFREASITYQNKGLTVSLGITGTRIFEFQQRFWGKRYIAKPYQSINGYGYVADLGVVVDFKINDLLKADVSVMNGEGYSNIQLDNNLLTSLGFTITPGENFVFRIYGDIQRVKGLLQPLFVGFAGFKNALFYIGGEASYKANIDLTEGHDAWGISATGGIKIYKNAELFCRLDHSSSVIIPGEAYRWNQVLDGDFFITGLQYTFSENVKAALNYQGFYPSVSSGNKSEMIFLNALFRF